jgi:hypothetical protein
MVSHSGYIYGANIVDSLPLYLEFGGNFQYSFGKEEYEEGDEYFYLLRKYKLNMYSLNVPVNLAFRFGFNDNKVDITPYLGLNFRVNVAGNLKYSYKDVYYDDYDDVYVTDEDSYKVNLFNKDEMEDSALKRFQVGINFGVGFTYDKFYIGVGYVADFSNLIKTGDEEFVTISGKLNMATISLGYNF